MRSKSSKKKNQNGACRNKGKQEARVVGVQWEYGTNSITETHGHSSFVYSVAEKPGGHWGKPGGGRIVKRETETDSQRSVRNSTGELIEFRLDSNIGGGLPRGFCVAPSKNNTRAVCCQG